MTLPYVHVHQGLVKWLHVFVHSEQNNLLFHSTEQNQINVNENWRIKH